MYRTVWGDTKTEYTRAIRLEERRHGKSRDYSYVSRYGRWHIRPFDWISTRKSKSYEVVEVIEGTDTERRREVVLCGGTEQECQQAAIAEHVRRVEANAAETLRDVWQTLLRQASELQAEMDAVIFQQEQVYGALRALGESPLTHRSQQEPTGTVNSEA